MKILFGLTILALVLTACSDERIPTPPPAPAATSIPRPTQNPAPNRFIVGMIDGTEMEIYADTCSAHTEGDWGQGKAPILIVRCIDFYYSEVFYGQALYYRSTP